MAPLQAKDRAATPAWPVAPQIHIASPMDYAGIQRSFSCFGDPVAIKVGTIPTALVFVASVSYAPNRAI